MPAVYGAVQEASSVPSGPERVAVAGGGGGPSCLQDDREGWATMRLPANAPGMTECPGGSRIFGGVEQHGHQRRIPDLARVVPAFIPGSEILEIADQPPAPWAAW